MTNSTEPTVDEPIPTEVVAMVERTFGPGVSIGPAIPQNIPDGGITIELWAERRDT